ncbi:MAG: SIMPL domain-containing protein [Candidatus Moraniibacteriota bacterium]|nr:MAG: SIMPL domain-containing protein [Candidatus Moranbacteria bacterium]
MFEESTRHSVKSLAWLLIAIAALLAAVEYARSVDKTYPTRTFSADGEGRIEVSPDVAKFSVSVVTDDGKDVVDVQAKNTEKMNAVTAFLKESAVAEKDLKTDEYTLSPRYDYPNCTGLSTCPQPSISGYSLTQTLRVTVRDTEKIGDLLSGVVTKGANSVSQVTFTVEDEDAAKADARKEAIEKAKAKAIRIASDAGFEMGQLVSIYETPNVFGFGGEGDMLSAKSAVANVPAPSIEPGSNETTVNVTLTYEIL